MVTWMVRRKAALWGALVLTFAMVGTAGATAGAMLHLGVVNTRHATTTLTGSTSGPEMKIINNGTGPALALGVSTNRPAFSVSSTAKVPKLNADRLDNLDSTQLQRRIASSCAAGSSMRSVSAAGAVVCEADDINGGDAATLGGIAPNGFYAAGSKVADSADADHADVADNAATLGGLDQSAFMRAKIDYNVSAFANTALAQQIGSVACDAGFYAVGGGVTTEPTEPTEWGIGWQPSSQSIVSSAPSQNGRGWSAAVANHSETSKTFHIYVICVPGTAATVSGLPMVAP